jgi:NADH-quinone oxidoreductase subunit L
VFAIGCAWGFAVLDNGHLEPGYLVKLLLSAEPAHVALGADAAGATATALPSHHQIHDQHATAGAAALIAAISGLALSWLIYVKGVVDPAAIARQMGGTYRFLVEKWQFDNLYDVMFVRPVHVMARWPQAFDKNILDGFLHWLARTAIVVAHWDRVFDERVVDRLVNIVGDSTYAVGRSLRVLQTGRLRQYVMFIAVGVVSLFILLFAFLPRA